MENILDKASIVNILSARLPSELSEDLVNEFLQMRQDVASRTLGRAAPGKFVESFVQALQFISTGRYDTNPKVDDYLRNIESKSPPFDDGLRICASRILRSMYTLRNKRNILHKGDVDPNEYDLKFLLAASQWTIAELVRVVSGSSLAPAGAIIQQAQTPVGALVEDFGDCQLVHGNFTIREELLLILHTRYPDLVPVTELVKSLERRNPVSVKIEIRSLWNKKLTHGSFRNGYKLTSSGLRQAIDVAQKSAI